MKLNKVVLTLVITIWVPPSFGAASSILDWPRVSHDCAIYYVNTGPTNRSASIFGNAGNQLTFLAILIALAAYVSTVRMFLKNRLAQLSERVRSTDEIELTGALENRSSSERPDALLILDGKMARDFGQHYRLSLDFYGRPKTESLGEQEDEVRLRLTAAWGGKDDAALQRAALEADRTERTRQNIEQWLRGLTLLDMLLVPTAVLMSWYVFGAQAYSKTLTLQVVISALFLLCVLFMALFHIFVWLPSKPSVGKRN